MGSKAPQYRCERCKDMGVVVRRNVRHGVFADYYADDRVVCPVCNGFPSNLAPRVLPSPPPPPKKSDTCALERENERLRKENAALSQKTRALVEQIDAKMRELKSLLEQR